jgi:sRNA-binding regulator protein Hfq
MSHLNNRGGNFKPGVKRDRPAKGHDAQLKEAQEKGYPAHVVLVNGSEDGIHGLIVNRDRYTITVLDRESGDRTIYYKHAIESIKLSYPSAV